MTNLSEIARLNDKFRASIVSPNPESGDLIVFSYLFRSLSNKDIELIIQKIAKFDDFNEDNDPWKEHDFGKISTDWHEIFWKIDYLSGDKEFRVLTVMLAEEY